MSKSGDIQAEDREALHYAKALLDDYATHMSPWKRFVTGNNSRSRWLYPFNRLWGRHHLESVNLIRAQLNEPGEEDGLMNSLQNSLDLLYRLHMVRLVNNRGSLSRRIDRIWNYLLEEDKRILLTQQLESEVTNGVILSMKHRPESCQLILEKVLALGSCNERTEILRDSLLYALTENERVNLYSVLPTLLQTIQALPFADKKSVLLPAVIKACQLNRLSALDSILNILFINYRVKPSRDYIVWISILASDMNEENKQAIMSALDNAIGETAMRVPKSWFPDKSAPGKNGLAFFQQVAMPDEEESSEDSYRLK